MITAAKNPRASPRRVNVIIVNIVPMIDWMELIILNIMMVDGLD